MADCVNLIEFLPHIEVTEVTDREREWHHKWYLKNRERVLLRRHQRYLENRETLCKYSREWNRRRLGTANLKRLGTCQLPNCDTGGKVNAHHLLPRWWAISSDSPNDLIECCVRHHLRMDAFLWRLYMGLCVENVLSAPHRSSTVLQREEQTILRKLYYLTRTLQGGDIYH